MMKMEVSNKGIKYEVIKTILVMKLIEKYKKEKFWLNFYSEFELEDNLICSLYFINTKSKQEVIYEISKTQVNPSRYQQFINKGYEFINIITKDFPNDIKGIEEKIEEIV